jgi:tetratricopeptide (TPR) repeat protein
MGSLVCSVASIMPSAGTLVRPFLSLLLLAAAAAGGAQTAADLAEESFARGVQLHEAGDILGAIEAYKDALAKEPSRIDARSNLGAAYVRLGRYEDAIGQYRNALEADASNVRVRFNLALALYKAARIAGAAEELQRVVGSDSANRSAVLLLADCDLQMGADRQVIELLSPLEEALGNDRLFAYLLGTALIRQNELQHGQVLIDRLLKDGESAEAHLLLGTQYLRRADYRGALPELKRAVELNAKLPTVQSLYGRALMGTGQREEAARAFRKELQANPNDFESNLYLGLLYKNDDRFDEALDYLGRAARMRPQDPGVLYALGSLHLAAGRVEAAQQALENLVQAAPAYEQGHVLLAMVYYRQKRKDLGDRERTIIEKLKAEAQAKEPGAQDDLGPAYLPEPPAKEPPRKRKPDRGTEKIPQ